MSAFCSINVSTLDYARALLGDSDNSPPPDKSVGLLAQCEEEGSGQESTDESVVVTTTARKRRQNGGGRCPAQRPKRAQCAPPGDTSDRTDSAPQWCHDDDLLPARVQQARRRGRVIWAGPDHTLSGGARCGPCVRAGVDLCFVGQAPACARCTSLRNPRGQCRAEPPTIAAVESGRPGGVVSRPRSYGGQRGGGRHHQQLILSQPRRPLPATTGTVCAPRSRSSTPEELNQALAVLPESFSHALRVLNAHHSRHRHKEIKHREQACVEEVGSEASSSSWEGFVSAVEELDSN